MKIISISVLFCTLMFSSCSDIDREDVPICIQTEVMDFIHKTSCKKDVSVDEYIFQGKKVYLFNEIGCLIDGGGKVLDEDCNYLGFLGGLNGNYNINGGDFSEAEFIRKIWEQ